MEEGRGALKILTCKPKGRPKSKFADNISMDIKGIGIRCIRGIRLIRLIMGFLERPCESDIELPGSISELDLRISSV